MKATLTLGVVTIALHSAISSASASSGYPIELNFQESYLAQMDRNGDARIDLDEYRAAANSKEAREASESKFKVIDLDNDGVISAEDYEQFTIQADAAINPGVRLGFTLMNRSYPKTSATNAA